MLAGPAFLTTALIEGARRPAYHPLRHPVSSLALGSGGRVQRANFVIAGALYGGAAVGLARSGGGSGGGKAVPALIGAAGLGWLTALSARRLRDRRR